MLSYHARDVHRVWVYGRVVTFKQPEARHLKWPTGPACALVRMGKQCIAICIQKIGCAQGSQVSGKTGQNRHPRVERWNAARAP